MIVAPHLNDCHSVISVTSLLVEETITARRDHRRLEDSGVETNIVSESVAHSLSVTTIDHDLHYTEGKREGIEARVREGLMMKQLCPYQGEIHGTCLTFRFSFWKTLTSRLRFSGGTNATE